MKATACSHSKLRSAVTRLLMSIFGVITAFAMASGAAAAAYKSRVLDGFPTDINDSSWVAGSSNGSAVLRTGRLRTLVSNGTANAVNNAGIVVGSRTDPSGTHAFRASPTLSDAIEDLELLQGGTYSAATAINESGMVVGYANAMIFGELIELGVYFPAGSNAPQPLKYFPEKGGVASYAHGVNNHGDIVGAIKKVDGKYTPFLRLASGEMDTLPGFDGLDAQAIAINDNKRIVGNVTYPNGWQRAFIFENGVRTDIKSPRDFQATKAYGLNQAGQVVGEFTCSTATCPFLFDNGVMTNLLSALPGLMQGSARAINNKGDIAIVEHYLMNYFIILSPSHPPPFARYSDLSAQPSRKPGDNFGSVIALHGDLAAIGAPGENSDTGAVYLYRNSARGWTEEFRLTSTDAILGGKFGAALAFDGAVLVVGAPSANRTYVFRRSGLDWTQAAVLESESKSGIQLFGTAVAVKGTRIVVGAPYAQENGDYYSGALYVFDWDGVQWGRTKLVPANLPSNTHMFLGISVQLDGNSVLAGAPISCIFSICPGGVVYLFQHQTNSWSELKLATNVPGGKIGFGRQVIVQNDMLAIRADSSAHLFRRGMTDENMPWVEQDWVTTNNHMAVDGNRLVTMDASRGKSALRMLKREGRIWVDAYANAFDVISENSSMSTFALQDNTLLVGSYSRSGVGAWIQVGVVTPFSICAEAPCPDAPEMNLAVTLEAPMSARVSEAMTHTITVTNLHTTIAARHVFVESALDSDGAALTWIDVPETCRASLWNATGTVTCSINTLAPSAQARFDVRIAAPEVSRTFTHNVRLRHAGPDPVLDNNAAGTTTAIVPTKDMRIEIYSPSDAETIKRLYNRAIELEFTIVNFSVDLISTVTVDTLPPQRLNVDQPKISLGALSDGPHSVTITLLAVGSTTPVVSKTVKFNVEIVAPSVALRIPSLADKLTCYKGELVSPAVTLKHVVLGAGASSLALRINGVERSTAMTSESALNSIDLCGFQFDTAHTLQAVLRNADGIQATSDVITFIPVKAIPKVTLRQPVDGNVDLARGGFTLIYEFARGYDSTQLAVLLNGAPLTGPIPTILGTNAIPLPAALLRDGANDLLITVTTEGREVQTAFARFSTQVAATPPKSKGGALGLWSLLLLALLATTRRRVLGA